jgi:hypothetical protein
LTTEIALNRANFPVRCACAGEEECRPCNVAFPVLKSSAVETMACVSWFSRVGNNIGARIDTPRMAFKKGGDPAPVEMLLEGLDRRVPAANAASNIAAPGISAIPCT